MSVHGNRAGRVVGILVSAILGFLAFAGTANADGEYEPNDSRGNPAGPIEPGGFIAAKLEAADDSDWYKFYVSEETEIRFTVKRTNVVNEEFNAEFVYANGDGVTFKRLSPGTNQAELVATVPPGKYFAWILGNPDGTAGGITYSITFPQNLSTFQAIQSGCTTAQGRVTSNTASVNSANAALAKANADLAKAGVNLTKAKKGLSKAQKKKAKTKKAKKTKKKAISKAKRSVKSANGSVNKAKAGVAGAKSSLAAVQSELNEAKADSDRLCGIEE